ncbi:hypothetical protein BV898_13611 [Hypsibius exemplaris]|uniref:Uncharacterized protein n=1 Tax=Hypsibius exemplaris TaxID=2072580 RepID=A0A1W0WAE2_HYPEX|nr:hypothetical protein BV898_13611 [Hypsibius exemplaris]
MHRAYCSHDTTYKNYKYYHVNSYCGKTISLSVCDAEGKEEKSNHAGVFQFGVYPERTCSFDVIVDSSDCHENFSRESFAVYLNIRDFNIGGSDVFSINETITVHNGTTSRNVKHLDHGDPNAIPHYQPKSVAQYRSTYSNHDRNPSHLTIALERDARYVNHFGAPANFMLTLDYVVLQLYGFSNTNESYQRYCRALSGYMVRDVYCETGDRVSCPFSYYPILGFNPAESVDYGVWYDQTTGTSPNVRGQCSGDVYVAPTTTAAPTLGHGEIVALVVGLVMLLLIVGAVCHVVYTGKKEQAGRRTSLNNNQQVPSTTPETIDARVRTQSMETLTIDGENFRGNLPKYEDIYPLPPPPPSMVVSTIAQISDNLPSSPSPAATEGSM